MGCNDKLEAGGLRIGAIVVCWDDAAFERCGLCQRKICQRPVWGHLIRVRTEHLTGEQGEFFALIGCERSSEHAVKRAERLAETLKLVFIFSAGRLTAKCTIHQLLVFPIDVEIQECRVLVWNIEELLTFECKQAIIIYQRIEQLLQCVGVEPAHPVQAKDICPVSVHANLWAEVERSLQPTAVKCTNEHLRRTRVIRNLLVRTSKCSALPVRLRCQISGIAAATEQGEEQNADERTASPEMLRVSSVKVPLTKIHTPLLFELLAFGRTFVMFLSKPVSAMKLRRAIRAVLKKMLSLS